MSQMNDARARRKPKNNMQCAFKVDVAVEECPEDMVPVRQSAMGSTGSPKQSK